MSKKQKGREVILDLSKYLEKELIIKFTGGREVTGTLKGYDALLNVVLDDVVEQMRDMEDGYCKTGKSRKLGLVVCRGVSIMTISPADGTHEIADPFTQAENAEE
eukprot:CAMPEP_0119131698 /NCGR_PEP_ID=MMETSP1310-20130426/10529_1 /TAXON_ID=464262 /ORGANISM="Genus nov. species nov., Strain RCC2339" /LENGTH=104 /DNA_ID=CAMNT_0007122289 /DNA_START=37 /DNA_END=351 /DNA_ORIENTATION=-